MATTRSRLPKTGTHGQEILDRYGNRWEYDAGQKLWLSKGTVTSPAIVTESANGLIDGEIFTHLQQLKQYVQSGVNLSPLKLLPGRNAYWYYFRSSDKLVKFKPENEETLRVEFDSARFYQLVSKQICQGPTGPIGQTGPVGLDGASTILEPCYRPSRIAGKQLDFAIFTPTPITDDSLISLPNSHVPEISLRITQLDLLASSSVKSLNQVQSLSAFYRNSEHTTRRKFDAIRVASQQAAMGVKQAIACDIPLSEVYIGADLGNNEPSITIEIDVLDPTDITIVNTSLIIDTEKTLESISFDPETNIVCGSVFLADANWDESWCVRSWQKGPDGFKGASGNCEIKIVECLVDDTNYLATCPIVNVRMDCERNVLYKLCSGLIDESCVSNVQLLPDAGTLTTSSPLDSVYASAQMTLDECKHINRYAIDLEEDDIPELDLVHWDPQPGCFTQRHYNRYKFDWIPETDIPACATAAKWYSATAVRPGQYPWEIVTAPRPPRDECCADEYFYCPNVQDGPCPAPEEPAAEE